MSNYQPYEPHVTTGYAQAQGMRPGVPEYGNMEPFGVSDRHEFRLRPEHPHANVVLILGILSLVLAGILGPFAWSLGNRAIRECQQGQYCLTSSLRVGRALGIAATILLIIFFVGMIVSVIVFSTIGILAAH
jgi:hypothetical protein